MTVTTETNDGISTISDYCVYADAEFGGNGDESGEPSYDCGSSDSDNVYGYITWDSDLSDGLDSGTRTLSFQALEGGSNGVEWNVQGGSAGTLQFTDQTYGAIQSVKIRAAVILQGCKCTLSGIVLKFYKNGSLVETITLTSATNPVADTRADDAPDEREQITTITPTNSDNTKLVVTGNLRLEAVEGDLPGPSDLQAQIFVFANDCGA